MANKIKNITGQTITKITHKKWQSWTEMPVPDKIKNLLVSAFVKQK